VPLRTPFFAFGQVEAKQSHSPTAIAQSFPCLRQVARSARGNLKKVAIARRMRKHPTWQSHLLFLSCHAALFPGRFMPGLVSASRF